MSESERLKGVESILLIYAISARIAIVCLNKGNV